VRAERGFCFSLLSFSGPFLRILTRSAFLLGAARSGFPAASPPGEPWEEARPSRRSSASTSSAGFCTPRTTKEVRTRAFDRLRCAAQCGILHRSFSAPLGRYALLWLMLESSQLPDGRYPKFSRNFSVNSRSGVLSTIRYDFCVFGSRFAYEIWVVLAICMP
jgi:hypothetical protein